MAEITSINNDLVKEAVRLQQRKYRDKENKFLLEGFKSIEEAYYAGIEIETVFVLSERVSDYDFVKDKLIITNDVVMKKISTTESSPNAIGVAYQKKYDKSSLNGAKRVVLLENIKDLGNLGTILRTSTAFGVDAVILYGESVDLYNPKCVRSSVGNLWKIPVLSINDFSTLQELFCNFERVSTLPRGSELLKDFTVGLPCLVMFGSESSGLSSDLINFATKSVKIEMSETVESLNLSVSCAIVLYAIFA